LEDRDSTGNIPTANQLATHLANKINFPNEEQKNLAKVAQYYQVVAGRTPLQQELHDIFNCDFPSGQLHSYLTSIEKPILIITTNYDDLIERTFSAHGLSYEVVIHTTDPSLGNNILWWQSNAPQPKRVNPKYLDIDLEHVTVIYKMHGAVVRNQPELDQYVITEDDYIDFISRMTKRNAIPAIFAEPFQKRHFLFLGHGLYDWNLRVVLNQIEKQLRRPRNMKSWAIQYQPSPLEQRFWQDRGVEVYDMTIDNFIGELLNNHVSKMVSL